MDPSASSLTSTWKLFVTAMVELSSKAAKSPGFPLIKTEAKTPSSEPWHSTCSNLGLISSWEML
jgi:hypothetical protein